MCSASAIGYSTTREPQNTQARWLTEPAVLALPQAMSADWRTIGLAHNLRLAFWKEFNHDGCNFREFAIAG